MTNFIKILLTLLVFLLPLHALFITYLKCKVGIDTDILRFWKEIIIILLALFTKIYVLGKNNFNINKIYQNNYLLGTITAFLLVSFVYIFFPFFEISQSNILGFKYDTFFLIALIIGFYLIPVLNNLNNLLKTLFFSISLILVIFVPWYIIGDISLVANYFGYSTQVSTYTANECIAFAQNVEGHHRFQGTFGGPIRFSVFLVVFYLVYLGYLLHYEINKKILRNILLIIPSIFIFLAVFFSYTKTSVLGLSIGILLFMYFANKYHSLVDIPKKVYYGAGGIFIGIMAIIVWIKRDLFLHLGAILQRLENLTQSVEMFFYNPLGYGLGIAGPASNIGNKFLPENWYIQILLEQGILGFSIFISIIIMIGYYLYKIMHRKKDYLSIGFFVAYISLCFMANFTHAFEESATSYIFFLLIGGYIGLNMRIGK